MKAAGDFNYKVALASGLKHLQRGKLRQAEEQFRYLVAKFPQADGGYRGLARVHLDAGDRPAALATLREGAAAISRAGDRPAAIALLREAVTLDPLDLASHRRLAAALALAGDVESAAREYGRFAEAHIAAGDPERARLEASYALETLGEIPALHELARRAGLGLRTVRGPQGAHDQPERVAEPRDVPEEEPAPADPAEDPRLAMAAQWAASRPASLQERVAVVSEPAPAPAPRPAPPAVPRPRADTLELEERASDLLARRDGAAAGVALEAARALTAEGKLHAASDLLLQMVATGVAVHEAQRELTGLTRGLGRDDLAAERERLLRELERGG